MHLIAAPFIVGGLVLKIYNNKKRRLVPPQKDDKNDDRQFQENRIHQQDQQLS